MTPRAYLIRAALLAVALGLAVLWLPPGAGAPVVAVAVLLLLLAARDQPEPSPRGAPEEPTELAGPAFTHLIDPLAEGVLLLDSARAVVAANLAAARILARPPQTMVGSSLIVALRDHALAEVARAATGSPVAVHVSSSGHDVLATATRVEAGPVHTLLVIEDVTELERARRARSDLIANLSHELRTPVAAARALAETLQAGVEEPAEAGRFRDRLVEEVGRLERMVERLLRLSRIESGSETLADEVLVPGDLLRTAAARIEPLAAVRGIRVECAAGETAPVRGDGDRVLEVLSNLLDNAVRHSPDGGRVRMQAQPDEEHAGFIRFEVSDDGPGVLPGERDRIFERFYTGDRARGSGGGTGLGLSIARHIVQRLGGAIWVADRVPGATLCFTLPIAEESGQGATHR